MRAILGLRAGAVLVCAAASFNLAAQLQPIPAQPLRAPAGAKSLGAHTDGKIASTLRAAVQAITAPPSSNAATALPDYVQSFIAREVAADQTIYVVIRGVVTDELVAAVQATGAHNVREYRAFGQVTAEVPAASISSIAQRGDVSFIGPRERPLLNRFFPQPGDPASRAIAKTGATSWQGVIAHQANVVQAAGIRGAGVKVCVMSDGVNSLASRQIAGELPAVSVLAGQAGNGDEGTAMLEIIADMAPNATLGFATAINGAASMASNIVALRASGCDIIVDDVSYPDEAAFQDDVIAQAVNQVTAGGAMYFSSAANSGNLANAGGSANGGSGTYEGDFVAYPGVPAIISRLYGTSSLQVHSFNGHPYVTLTRPTDTISFKWSDPTPTGLGSTGSGNDYDVVVVDAAETGYYCNPGVDTQNGSQPPVEITWCSTGSFPAFAHVYVVKWSGSARAIRLDTHRGRLDPSIATDGSTFGHNAAASAVSVGAVQAVAPGTVFTGANTVTYYSSDGPRKMFYAPNGTALTAGNVLFGTGGGVTVPKVDVAAADCGTTTTPGFSQFCGTSAAAPTVAGIAALVKSARPASTATQVIAAIKNTAIDIEAAGADADSGAGIALAPAAVRAVMVAPQITRGFSPASSFAGGMLTLTTTVTNFNAVALTGGSVSVTLPLAGMGPNGSLAITGAGCNAAKADTVIGFQLASITIPAATTCTFAVPVAVGMTLGAFQTTSDVFTTAIGLDGSAPAAHFNVIAHPSLILTVTATPNPAGAGASVTIDVAAASPLTGSPLPTANLALTVDGATACTLSVTDVRPDGSTISSCTIAPLAAGVRHIVANYPGDAYYIASSGTLDLTVRALTVTGVTSSSALPARHEPVVFTATVAADGTPTGSVMFLADGSIIHGCAAIALAAGVAKCSTGILNPGSHTVAAFYSGDAQFGGSNGAVSQDVDSADAAPPSGGGKRLDFSGDGHGDLAWLAADGTLSLWLMDGVSPIARGVVLGAAPGSVTRAGDLDGDGKAELIRQLADGSTLACFMNGLDILSTATLRSAGTGWHLINTGDFNGDRKADLVWRHDNGAVEIWLMDGATATSVATVMPAGTSWKLSKVADFNGDGKSDLMWVNTADGSTSLWLMNGATKTSGGIVMAAGAGWTATHVGDFNGDGKSDILWRHDADGAVSMWLMDGLAIVDRGSIMPGGTAWNVMLVANLDNDASSDILWRNADGTSSAWIMNGRTIARKGQLFPAGSPWTVSQAVDTTGTGNATLVWTNPAGNIGIWTVDWSATTNGTYAPLVRNPAFPAGSPWVPAVSLEQNR